MTATEITALLRNLCRERKFAEARLFFHATNCGACPETGGHAMQIVLMVWKFGGGVREVQLRVDYADCEKDYILRAYIENMFETADKWRC